MFKLTNRSRVGIVGAGPAGLCAAAHLKKLGCEPKVYERAKTLGGTWRYNEDPHSDASSSMYKNLRTNLPVQCMAFPDFPFQKLETSFPGHTEVLRYLQLYAEHHQIDCIDFNSEVQKIEKNEEKWRISTTDSANNFDFVIVANGHYTKPSLPALFENCDFEGKIIHSHVYRQPEEFSGKNVLVIGVGPSGTDISIDLLTTARKVNLLGGKKIPNLPEKISMSIGWPAKVEKSGVYTTNGDFIECDAIIVSSGYEYDFSFLDDFIKLSDCGKKVTNLYRQILPVEQPTIGCIGVPSIVVPFPLIDCQVSWLLSVWTGATKLPSISERIKESLKVPGIGGDLERHFHKMGTAQWTYNDLLAKEAGVEPIPRAIEQVYTLCHFQRREFGPVDYRNTKYSLIDNDSFTTVQ